MENIQKSFSQGSFLNKIANYFKTNKQKMISTLVLVSAIFLFIYSLGFSTGWALADQFGGRIGELITTKATPANRLMLVLSFLVLVSVIISMLLGTHKRQKFEITNYIAISVTSVLLLVTIIFYFIKIVGLSSQFQELLNDPSLQEEWKSIFLINLAKAKDIEFIFTLGIWLTSIAVVALVANVYLVVDKYLYANTKRVTYSEMMARIENGEVVVIENNKKNHDEIETIKIDLNKETKIIDMKVDKLRYQTNTFSYWLIMLSIIFVLIAGFMTITYNSFTNNATEVRVRPTILTAIDIVLIILTLLLSFLGAEKVKFYKLEWTYGVMGIAGLTIARIFFQPLTLFNKGELPGAKLSVIIILMLVAAALQIAGALIGYIKAKKLNAHLKEIGDK